MKLLYFLAVSLKEPFDTKLQWIQFLFGCDMNIFVAFYLLAVKKITSVKRLIPVTLLFAVCSIYAQEQLPVKDYTVGNKFIYSTFQEEVIADTIINGIQYGIVGLTHENRYERLYMRSNGDTVFQYYPTLLREQISYVWGQRCQNALGISFLNFSFGNACGDIDETISSPLMLYYSSQRRANQNSNWGSVRLVKPYGITEIGDSSQICRLEYFPGRGASRPSEYRGAGWFTVCYPFQNSVYRLVAGTVRGKPIRIDGIASPYFLRWFAASKTISYRQIQRVTLKLSSSITGRAANNVGIRSVQCSFAYDSSLIDIIALKTSIGNKPDSLRYSNGQAILYCTFLVDSSGVDIGYVDLQSKAVNDTSIVLNVTDYDVKYVSSEMPKIDMIVTPLNLSLQRIKLNFFLQSSYNTLSFGQRNEIAFGLSSLVPNVKMPLPSFSLALDTTDLDSLEILKINSTEKIIPAQITTNNGKREYFFAASSVSEPFPYTIGRIVFRSKSLLSKTMSLTLSTKSSERGIDYLPSEMVLRQQGLSELSLEPEILKQIAQGGISIKYIAPNPVHVNNVALRFIMGSSTDNLQIHFVNTLGVVVKSMNFSRYAYGIHEIYLSVDDIPPGSYYLVLRTDRSMTTRQILIQP